MSIVWLVLKRLKGDDSSITSPRSLVPDTASETARAPTPNTLLRKRIQNLAELRAVAPSVKAVPFAAPRRLTRHGVHRVSTGD